MPIDFDRQTIPAGSRDATRLDAITEWLLRLRWLYVVPVVLPLSLLFDGWWKLRALYRQRFKCSPHAHARRVSDIQAQIESWRQGGGQNLLCTARPTWMSIATRVAQYKKPANSIRVDLHDILDVDTTRGIVRTEPRVNIGQITDRLLSTGWTLPVMPELDDLTVGGLLLGYGVETSSHKYGLFADTVESCEVVLGDGRVVRCSRDENTDLFHALPWSHGSLGILTAVELRMIPCKFWIRLRYQPVEGLDEVCRIFTNACSRKEPAEFVEGIMFSKDCGIIMTADFVDEPQPGKINRLARWYKPWFYTHAEKFLDSGPGEEYVPSRHYYRRHARSMFWESGLIVPFGNHPVFRWLLGWMMPPKISFLRLTQSKRILDFYIDKHVIQDVLVSLNILTDTVNYLHELFEGYPLWLCPLRNIRSNPSGFVNPHVSIEDSEMYVDVGVFCTPAPVERNEPYNARETVKRMESFLIANHGIQALYAYNSLTHEQFGEMFDLSLYNRVRSKFAAQGVFMDVYDKVKWPGP